MHIQNLVDFMKVHDEPLLEELRAKFPEAKKLIRRGRDLGIGDSIEDQNLTDPKVQLLASGIRTLKVRGDSVLTRLTKRLNRATRLNTYGSVVSAFSSAGLVATLGSAFEFESEKYINLGLAILAFSSSLLAIYAERALGGPNGGKIREYFEKTISLSSQITNIDLKLQRMIISDVDDDVVNSLLGNADEIALKLRETELKLNVT